jgi:hypothetical protein
MTDESTVLRLRSAWRECQQHLHYLRYALTSLEPVLPLSGPRLQRLDAEAIHDLDQFVLRFGKLQDAIGSRLLPAVLGYLQEPYERRPMLDKLHRLEQLGYLDHAEDWSRLRVIRNQFAHDYPDEPEKNASLLNMAIEAAPTLEAILANIQQRLGSVLQESVDLPSAPISQPDDSPTTEERRPHGPD